MNILSSNEYEYLKNSVLDQNDNFTNINIKKDVFPDGEHYWKIENPELIKGKPAVYVCGTVDNNAIFELYNVASELIKDHCSELHMVLPYFGYSTMEVSYVPGEIVTAKNIARLISSIPMAPKGNFIYLLDLHSLGTQYYFEGSLHVVHLSCIDIIKKMIADCGSNVVLATTDAGRVKFVQKIAAQCNLDTAYIMKKRISGSETEILAINAEVRNKDVIIIDDMIRSGSSVINAAKAYKNAGANNIYVAIVHGIFCNNSIEKMKKCGCINKVLCTNSHVNATKYKDDFVKVYDIASVICAGLN